VCVCERERENGWEGGREGWREVGRERERESVCVEQLVPATARGTVGR